MKPVIVWLRNDLRLSDHPSFEAAQDRPVIPVYIDDDVGEWPLGDASRVWLHHSLTALNESLNGGLVIRKGNRLKVLQKLITETGADTVFWTRSYDPENLKGDALVKSALEVKVQTFPGSLFEPWTVLNLQKKPFQVFSPFWKKCQMLPVRTIFKEASFNLFKKPSSLSVDDLNLLPAAPWDEKIMKYWEPGEKGAKKLLKKFRVADYVDRRDIPGLDEGTSHLSPHLHFGEISPFQVWHAENSEVFRRQLAWREYATYLLYHFPYMVKLPFKEKYNAFPWRSEHLEEWKKGKTGYPIVDAGMRQLWETGWMHNRVRMVVGSFLVKDLLISWFEGACWFWDTLVDADLANNTLGWQWVGGMGPDAAPYFRIFNPVVQGERFDPEGIYVRKYVPELKNLPNRWIHRPFDAPTSILEEAGVILGKNYPYPLVNHEEARKTALQIYRLLKNEKENK